MPFFVSAQKLNDLELRARRAENALVRAEESLEAEKMRTSSEWKAVEMLRAMSEKTAEMAAADRVKAETAQCWIQQREGDIAELRQNFLAAILNFRNDSSDLRSLVRWAERLDVMSDILTEKALIRKERPAIAAAEAISVANARARESRREYEIVRNRLDLYERSAPWLVDLCDYTIAEVLEGIREESADLNSEEQEIFKKSVRQFMPEKEWMSLSESDRLQRALDIYSDPRRCKTPWQAGREYERFVGWVEEEKGYRVTYRGALEGWADWGIDLICENAVEVVLIQCKHLSRTKGIPVRENTVAQTFGAAKLWGLLNPSPRTCRSVICTSYELSCDAQLFAKHLGVEARIGVVPKDYPRIKLNPESRTGEKIFHLPFDQQYDRLQGADRVWTVKEAIERGFRHAYRWTGEN